jgi:uncharacterized membrane protein YedE/YeeE
VKTGVVAFVAGVVFAVGLGIGEMTRPDKVIAFLDLAGDWDPSLAFVMVGAIGFHAVTYRLISKRSAPLWAEGFHIPSREDLDKPLLVGAALFGVGWGISGFCPGPAVASIGSAAAEVGVFVLAMMAGMWLHGRFRPLVQGDDHKELDVSTCD